MPILACLLRDCLAFVAWQFTPQKDLRDFQFPLSPLKGRDGSSPQLDGKAVRDCGVLEALFFLILPTAPKFFRLRAENSEGFRHFSAWNVLEDLFNS